MCNKFQSKFLDRFQLVNVILHVRVPQLCGILQVRAHQTEVQLPERFRWGVIVEVPIEETQNLSCFAANLRCMFGPWKIPLSICFEILLSLSSSPLSLSPFSLVHTQTDGLWHLHCPQRHRQGLRLSQLSRGQRVSEHTGWLVPHLWHPPWREGGRPRHREDGGHQGPASIRAVFLWHQVLCMWVQLDDYVYMYVHFSEFLDWVFVMIILISASYVHVDHVTPIWHDFSQLKNNSS